MRNSLLIKNLLAEIKKERAELELLHNTIERFSTEIDIHKLPDTIVEDVVRYLNAKAAFLMLKKDGYLELEAGIGIDLTTLRGSKIPIDKEEIIKEVAQNRKPYIGEFSINLNGEYLKFTSALCIPLVVRDRAIGMIAACDKLTGESFTSYDEEILASIGIVVANNIDINLFISPPKLAQERKITQLEELKDIVQDLKRFFDNFDFRQVHLVRLKNKLKSKELWDTLSIPQDNILGQILTLIQDALHDLDANDLTIKHIEIIEEIINEIKNKGERLTQKDAISYDNLLRSNGLATVPEMEDLKEIEE